jgi:hypothetical protein
MPTEPNSPKSGHLAGARLTASSAIQPPSVAAESRQAPSATASNDADVPDSGAHSDGSDSPTVVVARMAHEPATATLAPARGSAQASLLGR